MGCVGTSNNSEYMCACVCIVTTHQALYIHALYCVVCGIECCLTVSNFRRYFGEKVGIYFTWIGFYTTWLLPVSLLGIVIFLYGLSTIPLGRNAVAYVHFQCSFMADIYVHHYVCVYHAYNYVYSIVSFVGHKYTYMYMYICTCTAPCSISGQVYTVYSTYTVYSV